VTEEEARDWLSCRVPRETVARIERYLARLIAEMPHQNLISAASADHIWARHVIDSAQLLELIPPGAEHWIDLGSGAGFPGLVIALCRDDLQVTLVESRSRRVQFLQSVVDDLGVADRVLVEGRRLEHVPTARYDVISARAFAPLDRLLPPPGVSAADSSHVTACWFLSEALLY